MPDNALHRSTAPGAGGAGASPFDLAEHDAYCRWRDRKLAEAPRSASELLVEVSDPARLTPVELDALVDRCRRANSVIYAAGPSCIGKAHAAAIARQLGLVNLDGNLCADEDRITSLRVMPGGTRHEGYIPYTDRPLNWHTDGYYNAPGERIRGMLLHCASPAAEGGENALLDHELAYLLLREEDPEYVRALMAPDAMAIPANVENGVEIRPRRIGPVFLVEPATGNLYMRYTARKRNVEWKQDAATQAAVAALERILAEGRGYVVRHRLEAGQGIVSNNALHSRTGFRDDPVLGSSRLIFRGRYYDRVRGTDFNQYWQTE